MAYEIPVLDISLPCSTADLSSRQYHFVNLSTAGKIGLASLGGRAIGVLQNKPSASELAQVRVMGITKVVSDGSVGPGELVASSTIGKAQASTAGSYRLGVVVSGTTSSTGVISVLLLTPTTT